jgi:gluconate 2-dehydrogenase gamma chain
MNPVDDAADDSSRRSFLLTSGGMFTSLWLASQWPGVTAAAHHADHVVVDATPPHFEFFGAADGADVDGVCALIVPSGATPGAREAHAVYFIDRSLATYFAGMATGYRRGLTEFQAKFRAAYPQSPSFAAADPSIQVAFLKTADQGAFFEMTRMLTVLGMFTSPKYGGNYQGSGWKLMGFVDEHAFTPPFGYYDAGYKGFGPYAEKRA